jgi:hypothetical protein
MAWSPSQAFSYDDEVNQDFVQIGSSEEEVTPYSDLTMSNPTLPMYTFADGSEVDATIDPALLTNHHVSSDISAHDAPIQQP